MYLQRWLMVVICNLMVVTVAIAESQVTAVLETPARLDGIEGHYNDPDDPAIWIHPQDPTKSLVITTLKEGGMDVYDLQGQLIQHITPKPIPHIADNSARFNNVDITYGSKTLAHGEDLAVASDRYNDMLRIFTISPWRLAEGKDPLVEITAPDQDTIFNDDPEEVAEGDYTTYGLAVTQPKGPNDRVLVFVSQDACTTLAKLLLVPKPHGKVGYQVLAKHNLPETFVLPDGTTWEAAQDDDDEMSQVEGIVVDDRNGVVYFGQEQVGIWKGPIMNTFRNLVLIDKVNEFGVPYLRTWNPEEEEYDIELLWELDRDYGSDYLSADVEGLTIYDAGRGAGYLIVSSQGSDQFVVYDRNSNDYIGNFSVIDDTEKAVDGVQESDGAAVTYLNLGGDFESGLLVVQDGHNTPLLIDEEGEEIDNANFKYIRWDDVANTMGLVIHNQ
jgi:3-phytase